MKCMCIRNNSLDLPQSRRDEIGEFIRLENSQTYLEVGKEYFLVGIVMRHDVPWYYVYEDDGDEHPIPLPCDYFEANDLALDSSWKLVIQREENAPVQCQILPKEWAEFEGFYERLLEEDPVAISIMESIKSKASC